MIREREKGEERSVAEIREHYEVEVELADRLKNSSKTERKKLYTSLYDELFSRIPHHQQLTTNQSPQQSQKRMRWQIGLLKKFINSSTTLLEIGAGDCALSACVSKLVKEVVAYDVSTIITNNPNLPQNCKVVISDGTTIPLPDKSIDVVYSNQLMEHLHPDDAKDQLSEIYRVLRVNGVYLCNTPNRVNGPWDISFYYDETAKGFHLKEYRIMELISIFRAAGFRAFKAYAGARGVYIRIPVIIVSLVENALLLLPFSLRKKIDRNLFVRMILGIRLAAIK